MKTTIDSRVIDYSSYIEQQILLTKEQELEAWQNGDKDSLIRSQLRFTIKFAVRFAKTCNMIDYEAAISAASEALCLAVNAFDGSKGFRLSTLVKRYIQIAIWNEVQKERRGVGPSYKVQKSRNLSCQALGKIDSKSKEDSISTIEYKETISTVQSAIDRLEPRMRDIVKRRSNGETILKIATIHGISRARVSQLEIEAKDRLRAMLEPISPY